MVKHTGGPNPDNKAQQTIGKTVTTFVNNLSAWTSQNIFVVWNIYVLAVFKFQLIIIQLIIDNKESELDYLTVYIFKLIL